MNPKKHKYKILLFLFAISFIASVILSINLLKPSPLICGPSEGCSIVANSEYSKTFGMENAYLGFVFFLALILLTTYHIKRPIRKTKLLINFGTLVAGLWAIYSLYLMNFVIEAFCKYCTALDVSSLFAVALVIYAWKE